MSVLDVFKINQIKAELAETVKERDRLLATLSETDRMDYAELKKTIADLQERKDFGLKQFKLLEESYNQRKAEIEKQIADLQKQIEVKKQDLIIMDDEILLQSFGFYKPKYALQNSEEYKLRLDKIRGQQDAMVKAGKAAYGSTNWSVNNSQREGEKMVKDYVKLILRSFNNECDASIINVKFNNIDSIEKKIRKAFETLNNLGKRMSIVIAPEYLKLKIDELYLYHEYQQKKQEEKEEQKRLRAQMREEAKLLKEIEEAKLKLGKEEKHFNKALEKINSQLDKVTTDSERETLEKEKELIEQKLGEVQKNMLDVETREQNTRAGYVYIISNIGSFGENVYKIGVTRRLDPTERVDELGDASVPFDFDIHALIFSEDAPALENALHKAFENRRVNMINRRREFFKVSLSEIEQVVKKNFKKPVEIVELADAEEYRESLVLQKDKQI